MNAYELWTEGYRVQGNALNASLTGIITGDTFDDAVTRHVAGLDSHRRAYWRRDELGHWRDYGMHVFDNEADARAKYGWGEPPLMG